MLVKQVSANIISGCIFRSMVTVTCDPLSSNNIPPEYRVFLHRIPLINSKNIVQLSFFFFFFWVVARAHVSENLVIIEFKLRRPRLTFNLTGATQKTVNRNSTGGTAYYRKYQHRNLFMVIFFFLEYSFC